MNVSVLLSIMLLFLCVVAPLKATEKEPVKIVDLKETRREYTVVGKCRVKHYIWDWNTNVVQIAKLKNQAQGLGADAMSFPKIDGAYMVADAIKWK